MAAAGRHDWCARVAPAEIARACTQRNLMAWWVGLPLIFLREAPLQQPPVLDALAPAAPVSQAYTRSIAYDPEGAYIASVNKPGRS